MVALAVSSALQFVLPPVLLKNWHDSGYALFIAIQGFAAYMSLADAGVQAFLTQRLTVLRAQGEDAHARGLAVAGLRAFCLASPAAMVVVFLAFLALGRPVWTSVADAAGVPRSYVVLALVAQLVSGAAGLSLSGWSSAVEGSAARYVRQQAMGVTRTVLGVGTLAALAALHLGPALALSTVSVLLVGFDLVRVLSVRRLLPPAAQRMRVRVREVLVQARGSLFQNLASATQTALQPLVVATASPTAAAIAVPGRTLSNAARSLSSAVGSTLWVELSRQLAGAQSTAIRAQTWVRFAAVLAAFQMLGLWCLAVAAPALLPFWIPSKAGSLLSLIPFYIVEHAALVAAVPSMVLLQAVGRFGSIGALQLVSALVAASLTALWVPSHGAVGFAGAGAVATVAILAPGLVAVEWSLWRSGKAPLYPILGSRLIFACLAGSVAAVWRVNQAAAKIELTVLVVAAGWHALRQWRAHAGPAAG